MKKYFFLIFLLLFPFKVFAVDYYAAHDGSGVTCSVGSPCALEYCVETKSSAGDTVHVTAGEYTQSTQILINKAITVIGDSGYASSIINNTYAGKGMFYINPGNNVSIRISGLYIRQPSQTIYSSIYILGSKTDSYNLNQIRIDNCKIEKGLHALFVSGRVEGVIDNNIFNNCNIAVMIIGDGKYSWKRDITPGTANALFIEDNTFTGDEANREIGLNEQIYHQGGGRTVTRYNTFDLSAITTQGAAAFYDSHGNQSSSSPKCLDPVSMFRGQPLIEIYENTFKSYNRQASNGRWIGPRGGSSLIYSNDFYTSNDQAYSPIRLAEEEVSLGGNFPDGPCTVWPSEDQINNTFIWDNNTYWNGDVSPTAVTDIVILVAETDYIVEDRDYFMHAPESSGGKETLDYDATTYGYLTGKAYGNNTGMTFSAAGANAYYPYTAYTYPHPLQGVGGGCGDTTGAPGLSSVGYSGIGIN